MFFLFAVVIAIVVSYFYFQKANQPILSAQTGVVFVVTLVAVYLLYAFVFKYAIRVIFLGIGIAVGSVVTYWYMKQPVE